MKILSTSADMLTVSFSHAELSAISACINGMYAVESGEVRGDERKHLRSLAATLAFTVENNQAELPLSRDLWDCLTTVMYDAVSYTQLPDGVTLRDTLDDMGCDYKMLDTLCEHLDQLDKEYAESIGR